MRDDITWSVTLSLIGLAHTQNDPRIRKVKHKCDAELLIDTPYFALTSNLWGVHCGYLGENYILSQHKNRLSRYGIDSQYKDKKVLRPSYLYHGNSYIGKTVSW